MSKLPRIASLLPSATEIVHFVGAGGGLVGVTHECDYPPGVENLPRLTGTSIDQHSMTSAEIDAAVGERLTDSSSIYSLDAGLLGELSPDLVLTQGLCDLCAVSSNVVERATAALSETPHVLSMNPTTMDEVLDVTVEVGDAIGRGGEAREKVSTLRERLVRVEEAVAGQPWPRVGCIEWLDPPFSAGHWVPDMVRLAGGEELFARSGEPSKRLSWEGIFKAASEVFVLMPCGFDATRVAREARELPEISGWENLPAVKNGRVWAVDANSYYSRPAPRLVEGVETLAHILHPEVFFPEAPEPEAAARLSYAFG